MIDRELAGLPDNAIPESLMVMLCYRYNRNNLYQLLQFLGTQQFVKFLGAFAGCYLKLPPADRISKLIDDYRMILLSSKALRAYRERNMKAWEEYDKQFRLACRRNHIEEETGRKKVKKSRHELKSAIKWIQSPEGKKIAEKVHSELGEAMAWYLKLLRTEHSQNRHEI